MSPIILIATTRLGLESIVREELEALGFDRQSITDGSIEFEALLGDIPRLNLWLRCADRLLLKIGAFRSVTFDELYEGCKALPWENLITEDGKFVVQGKSVKSALRSVRSCQSIVKKAVADRLGTAYGSNWLSETGPEFPIRVSLLQDVATFTIDTSGIGLHKRGYRAQAVEAPLKETLAAALVKLSHWDSQEILIDPMCGSGTILIEAALLARNIAPGMNRTFTSEAWPAISSRTWHDARSYANEARRSGQQLQVSGYDIDGATIEIAKSNARIAGVADDIRFETRDIHDLWIDRQYGVVISNPPYGLRISGFQEINRLYTSLNKIFRKKAGWSVHILTADDRFPDFFKRSRPDKVQKLYNGTIEAYYYHYLGAKRDGSFEL